MRQLPTDPATPRERRPSGFTERMASARPGASRSIDRAGRLRRDVGRREPRAPRGHDESREPGRQLDESGRDRGHPVGNDAPIDDAKPVLDEDAGQLVTGSVLAGTHAGRF